MANPSGQATHGFGLAMGQPYDLEVDVTPCVTAVELRGFPDHMSYLDGIYHQLYLQHGGRCVYSSGSCILYGASSSFASWAICRTEDFISDVAIAHGNDLYFVKSTSDDLRYWILHPELRSSPVYVASSVGAAQVVPSTPDKLPAQVAPSTPDKFPADEGLLGCETGDSPLETRTKRRRKEETSQEGGEAEAAQPAGGGSEEQPSETRAEYRHRMRNMLDVAVSWIIDNLLDVDDLSPHVDELLQHFENAGFEMDEKSTAAWTRYMRKNYMLRDHARARFRKRQHIDTQADNEKEAVPVQQSPSSISGSKGSAQGRKTGCTDKDAAMLWYKAYQEAPQVVCEGRPLPKIVARLDQKSKSDLKVMYENLRFDKPVYEVKGTTMFSARSGDHGADVGGNIGASAHHFAGRGATRVDIYEPSNSTVPNGTYQRLLRHCEHPIFRVFNYAVDLHRGILQFRDLEESWAGASRNSLENQYVYRRKDISRESHSYPVNVLALTEAIYPGIHFVKLDCEGSELSILLADVTPALQRAWETVRVLYVEISANRIRRRGQGWHVFGRICTNLSLLGFTHASFSSKAYNTVYWTCEVSSHEMPLDMMAYFYKKGADPLWERTMKDLTAKQARNTTRWLNYNQEMSKKDCRCRTCQPVDRPCIQ